MRLGPRATSAVNVEIGGKTYTLQPFKRSDWKAWGDKLDQQRYEKATADVQDPVMKAKIAAFFPQGPLTLNELLWRCDTTEGICEIVGGSLLKAGCPQEDIDQVLDNTDMRTLNELCKRLLGLNLDGLAESEAGKTPSANFTNGSAPESKP